ncbi:MAG: signal peptidase II [Acidimicrobiales bacterium]
MTDRPTATGRRRRRIAAVGAIATSVVAADQVTKSLAVADLSSRDVHVIGPFWLRLTYNTGVAFSVGRGLTGPIIIVAVALVLAVAWLARGVPTMSVAAGLGLVMGGAIGNLSDRVFRAHHGAVVDFLYIRFWPTFNVADASIVTGCALLAVAFARSGRPPLQAASSPAERSAPAEIDPPTSPAAEQSGVGGHREPGHLSTGHLSTGDRAAGDRAAGHLSTGDRAAGDRAAGHLSTGDRAAGRGEMGRHDPELGGSE